MERQEEKHMNMLERILGPEAARALATRSAVLNLAVGPAPESEAVKAARIAGGINRLLGL